MKIKINGNIKKVIPDIIICSPQKVIAVIELKYLPRGQPKYEKDLETLALISKHRNKIKVTNKRFRGENKQRTEYDLSSNMLFVWASVHAEVKKQTHIPYSHSKNYLKDCYLELHAETADNKKPHVYIR